MSTRCSFRLLVLICIAIPAAAGAQSMSVIGGESTARACYRSATLAAQMNIATSDDLKSCTYALEHTALRSRDRGATYLNRGIINVALERYEAAKRDYQKARELLPDKGEIYVNRGNMFFMGGIFDQAVDEYSHALSLGVTKEHIAYFNRGLAYEKLGNYRKAQADYRTAMDLSPAWQTPRHRLERLQDRLTEDEAT